MEAKLFVLLMALVLPGLASAETLSVPATPKGTMTITLLSESSYGNHIVLNPNGTLTGDYVERVREIFAKIPNVELKLETVAWKRGVVLLENGEALGMIGMYHRPAERPWVEHGEPYAIETTAVFCNRKGALGTRQPKVFPDDFYGLEFGMTRGYLAGGQTFFQTAKEGKIKIEEFIDNENVVLAMSTKKIDCMMVGREVFNGTIEALKAKGLGDFREAGINEVLPHHQETMQVGFSKKWLAKHPEHRKIVSEYNQIAKKMKPLRN